MLTWDQSTVRLYLNGEEEGSWSSSAMTTPDSQSVHFGSRVDGYEYFDGVIDEARISTAARSSDWIRAEYGVRVQLHSDFSAKLLPQADWHGIHQMRAAGHDDGFKFCGTAIDGIGKMNQRRQ